MTTKQKIKLNMFMAVRNFVRRYESIVKSVTKFSNSFEQLKQLTDEIQAVSQYQGTDRKGYSRQKNMLRKRVTALAVKNASKLAILARQNGNKILLAEIDIKEWDFARLTEAIVVDKARIVWDRVEANLQSLADQGVSVDTQKEFLEAISAFNEAISEPRAEIGERRKATQKLIELFITADECVKTMDYAAESVRDEKPDFYKGYKAARVLVDISSGTILIKGSAREFLSGKPVGRAIFKFSGTNGLKGTGNGQVIKRTSVNGNFLLRSLVPGTYNVLVSKPGYKDKELSIIINEGEKMEMKVEMEKA